MTTEHTTSDPSEMDTDELFALLGLSDMDDRERLEFVRYMNAWSRHHLPGPNKWWIQALLQANLWRQRITEHVDSLITQALGQ
ncbi:hypothetical protein P3F83_18165 [Mycobacteroides immunogenum]|uniref:hypothetical protein n=1 Tax=Mycobacteroides immunogenum TaxID=83262 RepID=UPI0025B77939|nr:hypothetical protein [Mycobacteroides immunogenum]WJR32436.1 hypothetical protein P3F83_18165 [Mycobacteroides immunogenum]